MWKVKKKNIFRDKSYKINSFLNDKKAIFFNYVIK